MILVDTSAFVEWLIGSKSGAALIPLLPEPDAWLVPTLVQLELAKWVTRERGEEKADEVIAFTESCRVVPLDTVTALRAAELCRLHKLATADAVIYATALEQGARLLTCDAHFEDLDGVDYHRKWKA
ncbi:MAG: type II toxin-antitoxin system VapC family toxin [Alphaproteobacteria bacterium]|nr:type II toxin-antitoxin system VapC family toxin [Alphaproteobacteria bacterium]